MKYILAILLFFMSGCGPFRPPVPVGVVPELQPVTAEDERYGHEVLNQLNKQFPLDDNDQRINRVRKVAARLTETLERNSQYSDPWHVYVLADNKFKNAAATRGNYIFVWSALVDEIQDDAELATVISHEIGHVLANHTSSNPSEETAKILSDVAGRVTREVILRQRASPPYSGMAANLGAALVAGSIQAFVLNPELQRQELEADQIGLFLMADSKYDPEKAVAFWQRVGGLEEFGNTPLQFLSSHPSSEARLENLKQLLPLAKSRYLGMAPYPAGDNADDGFAIFTRKRR